MRRSVQTLLRELIEHGDAGVRPYVVPLLIEASVRLKMRALSVQMLRDSPAALAMRNRLTGREVAEIVQRLAAEIEAGRPPSSSAVWALAASRRASAIRAIAQFVMKFADATDCDAAVYRALVALSVEGVASKRYGKLAWQALEYAAEFGSFMSSTEAQRHLAWLRDNPRPGNTPGPMRRREPQSSRRRARTGRPSADSPSPGRSTRKRVAVLTLEDILPTSPWRYYNDPAEIDAAQRKLGTRFPAGYREFIARLGFGTLAGFLRVYPPRLLYVDEWRARIAECWHWDEGSDVLTQAAAFESIVFADTWHGDEFVFHPAMPDRVYALPRDGEMIYVAGDGLLSALEWVLTSGVLMEPGRELIFEPEHAD